MLSRFVFKPLPMPLIAMYLLYLMFANAGCSSGYLPGHAYRRGDYDWGFINHDGQELRSVDLRFLSAGEECGASTEHIFAKGWFNHGGGVYPVPETGTIHWRTPDGRIHEQEVVIRAVAPTTKRAPDPKYFAKGTFWFVYDGKQWTVIPLTDDEVQRRIVEEKKSYPLEVVY